MRGGGADFTFVQTRHLHTATTLLRTHRIVLTAQHNEQTSVQTNVKCECGPATSVRTSVKCEWSRAAAPSSPRPGVGEAQAGRQPRVAGAERAHDGLERLRVVHGSGRVR